MQTLVEENSKIYLNECGKIYSANNKGWQRGSSEKFQ